MQNVCNAEKSNRISHFFKLLWHFLALLVQHQTIRTTSSHSTWSNENNLFSQVVERLPRKQRYVERFYNLESSRSFDVMLLNNVQNDRSYASICHILGVGTLYIVTMLVMNEYSCNGDSSDLHGVAKFKHVRSPTTNACLQHSNMPPFTRPWQEFLTNSRCFELCTVQ